MHVIATAGHVDHGKSALVRALTGIEPDRWDEERRRGLTIDLGYAWTTLPSGEQVAFVDVPGHQRFIGNMLAGVGPTSAVVFVVAADEGWRQQSQEHLAAVDALGISHGLLVVTRSDLADPASAMLDAHDRLAATSLGETESLSVSARTGAGMTELTDALVRLVAGLPPAQPRGRVRLWVDRSFSIRGSGTVVTGTLAQGSIAVGDELQVGSHRARVRGLESLGRPRDRVLPVARVAVNLRGVAASDVARGDLLLTLDAWRMASVLDVRVGGQSSGDLPTHLTLHAGTAAAAVHVRPLADDTVRLTLSTPLPLIAGDRLILRDAGAQRIVGGALVLDADPPELRRRGAAARRGADLASATGIPDLLTEVERRGAMLVADAAALGIQNSSDGKVLKRGAWLVSGSALQRWADTLTLCVQQQSAAEPLQPSLTIEAAKLAAGVPDRALLPDVLQRAGLDLEQGRVWLPGVRATMGAAERGLQELEARLQKSPFAAPEQPDLAAAGIGPREVAAAVRAGRLLRLPDGVLLAPGAPAKAMLVLAGLAQPFTLSEARQALDTTRRVAVPLLEYLDGRGWTRRVDGTHRVVVR